MTNLLSHEVIIVRSLTDSDLGIFAAHRPTTASKQRAININATIAQQLLSQEIIDKDGAHFQCRIIFHDTIRESTRHFGKVGKNWRLGGNMIEGETFLQLDSRDFALIRSVEKNDGSKQMSIMFISRTAQSFQHARISRLVEPTMRDSMEIYREGSAGFQLLAVLFPSDSNSEPVGPQPNEAKSSRKKPIIPPMPRREVAVARKRTIGEKLRSSHILEQMLKVSSDLSAPAQLSFIDTVGMLASQLREALIASKKIIVLKKDHLMAWRSVKGKQIGFVDGGLANLSMLGSAPIAARVGGYVVRPGDTTDQREKFIVLKKLINELYSSGDGGVYNGSFPDISALRDAARISIEAAGAVRLVTDDPSIEFLFMHGALVNPVSRYTDVMRDGKPVYHFPHFSSDALGQLLPNGNPLPEGRNANFVNVYLQQLHALRNSRTSVCGVIEREATTSSVIRNVLESLEDHIIRPVLPMPPEEWKRWFRDLVDPVDEDEALGQRITDSLLFRCLLEPGEALMPIEVDRNEMRRAPDAWKDIIAQYPRPMVSYLQATEWTSPIRLEIFDKDLNTFHQTAELIYHCSLLLPRYSFPAGLDIVDKFARIPNWMSKPINTNTAVQALKSALYKGDERLFDSLRRMLCGSSREWLLRPGVSK
jgi:hypothetical protein